MKRSLPFHLLLKNQDLNLLLPDYAKHLDLLLVPVADESKSYHLDDAGLITEYSFGTIPHGLVEATASGSTFSATTHETTPTTIKLNDTGTLLFVAGNSTDSVYSYILTSAYDLSTATTTNYKSFSLASEVDSLQSVVFSSDGLKMYALDATTKSVYQYGLQRNATNANAEDRSTASNIMKTCTTATGGGVGKPYNFYCYLYNLGDSSKYSFQSSQGFGTDAFAGAGTVMNSHFGSAVLPQASTVDGIRITTSTGVDLLDFDISLYGIAES